MAVCVAALALLVSVLLGPLMVTPLTSTTTPAPANSRDASSARDMSHKTSSAHVMSDNKPSADVTFDNTPSADITSEDTSPARARPEDKSSERAKPEDKSPARAKPEDKSSERAKPEDKSSERAKPEDKSPACAKPEDKSSERVAPEDKSSERFAPEDTSSAHVMTEDKSSAGIASKDTFLSLVMPERTSSIHVTPDDIPSGVHSDDTADKVVLQPVVTQSSALTGWLCGDHSCSSLHDDFVIDILVTADKRVVLAMDLQQCLVVQSSSGVHKVKLGCNPRGLTQLPSGLIAVTCPWIRVVLLVSLGSDDYYQIQQIQTSKTYFRVAAHPADEDLLIVGTWPEPGLDVIRLQDGEVVRTFADRSQVVLEDIRNLTVGKCCLRLTDVVKQITSLTVDASGCLLVTDIKSGQIQRIHHLLDSPGQEPSVESLTENWATFPWDTAVDKAGNVFVVLLDGSVVTRSPGGINYRPLLTERTRRETYGCRIALHDNSLLVVTVIPIRKDKHNPARTGVKSVVTEHQLVYQ